jgi:hypothetical protein
MGTRPLFFAYAFLLFAGDARVDTWNCYDSQPGHPTVAERMTFIQDVSAPAVQSERKHGVPATALVAMAIVESGYGWTRTAINANNLFGWKHTNAGASDGLASYTLTCQPPGDVNNKYIVFHNRAEAIDYVAHKLATLAYYRTDTEAYKAARARGDDVITAVKAWIAGISDPYNWHPAEYVHSVTRVMNNPVAPSDTISSEYNLYKLSQEQSYEANTDLTLETNWRQPSTAVTALIGTPEEIAATKAYFSPRVGHLRCDPPDLHTPRWEGFPVTKCRYSDVGVTTTLLMLNPSADQLARWTVTACHDAEAASISACTRHMEDLIWRGSTGLFPVSGYLVEPASAAGGTGDGPECMLFRDGVTISTDTWDTQPAKGGNCGPDDETVKPATAAKRYSRVASTTREEYYAGGGTKPAGASNNRDPRWVDVIRELYQAAWTSDRNELVSAKAKAEKQKRQFQ